MRWFFLALALSAWTPIYSVHDTTRKVDEEVRGMEASLQDQQYTVYKVTPTLTALKDGQIVIVGSGTWMTLQFRQGQEIWSIRASCATVTR